MICVDPAAVVSGFGADPEVRAGNQGLLHLEDTTPLPIGGAAIASPTTSLWQTDNMSLRLILRAAWAVRVPGAVAWTSGVVW